MENLCISLYHSLLKGSLSATLQEQQRKAIVGFGKTAMPHLLAACNRRVLVDHLHPVPHIPPCGNLLYALHNAHMPDPAANLLLSRQKVLYIEVLKNMGDRPQVLRKQKGDSLSQ